MKKYCTAILLMVTIPALAVQIRVGPGLTCSTITQGLKLASPGDTVYVLPGTYKEKNLVISKSIHLEGIGNPILDGEKKYEVISVTADAVTIRGFTIQNSGVSSINDFAGIKVYDRKRILIAYNRIIDCFFGVYLQNCVLSGIENNIIIAHAMQEQQSGNGIHAWKCDSLLIRNNWVKGHRDGIYFEFVTNSVISNNASYKNLRYGLHFMFSNNDSYVGNVFENNGAGVAVMFSNKIKMYRNRFEMNRGDASYGILLKEISDGIIERNLFSRNTTAIYAEGANRIAFRNNEFMHNGWAIKMQASCMDLEITKNNFTGNSFDMATNGSLVLNTFNGNYWDKYEGYDLNRDGKGDVPYRPVSLFSMIVEKNPSVMILFRSMITSIMDKSEKLIPGLTPENLKDDAPLMKPVKP